MIEREIICRYKFPSCRKYWLTREKDIDSDDVTFDVSFIYSSFYLRRKSLQEAEEYLLRFIKEKARRKLKAARKVVDGLIDFLEDERVLTDEELLEKYKIKG
jgi:hypothetical protein